MHDDHEPVHHRYLIVGGGPGGLQMAHDLARAGRDYLLLDRAEGPGGFFERFPRHRTLISINKRYNFFEEDDFNLRHDWNSLLSDDRDARFTHYSEALFPHADDYVRYLRDFTKRFELNARFGQEVTHIDREAGGRFVVDTPTDRYTCDVLLLGLGAVLPVVPDDIVGIEHAVGYEDMSLDLDDYRNKRVAVIGQGNSAFETADHLAPVAAFVHILARHPVKMAWETHYPGHLRAINNNTIDLFQLKSLHAVLSPRVLQIERHGDIVRTTHEYDYPTADVPGTLRLTRDYDVIIRACGWRYLPPGLFADELEPELTPDGKYPAMSPEWQSTNVPDLYFIGTAMAAIDKKSASAFIHGFRYNVRTLANLLGERYEGDPYPSEVLDPFDWDGFSGRLHQRLSVAGTLYQLFGTLCDVWDIDADAQRAVLRADLPTRSVEGDGPVDTHRFIVTLEFGFEHHAERALDFLGPSDPGAPEHAAFLHPVIRYRHGEERDELHFADSLLGRWDLSHATGGAVSDHEARFRRWVHEKLGLPVDDLPEPTLGDYRPWTAEEVASWNALPDPAPGPQWPNNLSTGAANWRRTGAEGGRWAPDPS